MKAKSVYLYTDGSSLGNPGPGGYGIILEWVGMSYEKEFSAGFSRTTNNRMELKAAIKALEFFDDNVSLSITTDSNYVKDGITKWLINWKKKNWVTASKKPVKNKDLWEQLDALNSFHNVSWQWVKAHAGHRENEIADMLANKGIDEL